MANYGKAATELLEHVREEERKRLYKLVKGELNRLSRSLDALYQVVLPDKELSELSARRTELEGEGNGNNVGGSMEEISVAGIEGDEGLSKLGGTSTERGAA